MTTQVRPPNDQPSPASPAQPRRIDYIPLPLLSPRLKMPHLTTRRRWQEDPPESSRERCLQTVLEVPQRGHPEEVQGAAPGWQPRQQAKGGGKTCRRANACCGAQGRRSREEARHPQGRGGGRGAGAIRRADPLFRPELVPRSQYPALFSGSSAFTADFRML